MDHKKIRHAVVLALRKSAAPVRRAGPAHWDFKVSNGAILRGMAHLEQEWLTLSGWPAQRRTKVSAGRALELLCANHRLVGDARIAVSGSRRVELRVERALRADADPFALTQSALQCLQQSIHQLSARGKTPQAPSAAVVASMEEACAVQNRLAETCREAGWPCEERADGTLSVRLDVADGIYAGTLQPRADASARAFVRLPDESQPAEAGPPAVAVFLLRACRVVRLVRATAAVDAGRLQLGFEAEIRDVGCADDVLDALRALSVACRLCGREASALCRDQTLALAYLAGQGWLSNGETHNG